MGTLSEALAMCAGSRVGSDVAAEAADAAPLPPSTSQADVYKGYDQLVEDGFKQRMISIRALNLDPPKKRYG